MFISLLTCLVALLFCGATGDLNRKGINSAGFYGRSETLFPLMDIKLQGPQGQKLQLGYKFTKIWLFLGIFAHDDGSVLIDATDGKSYMPVLDGSKRTQLVEAGMLPGKFPTYKVPGYEYFLGFSLWIMVAIGLLVKGADNFYHLLKRRGGRSEPPMIRISRFEGDFELRLRKSRLGRI